MSNVLGELFGDIANAIRSKTGGTDTIKPIDFPNEIANIQQGSGGVGEGFVTVTFMNGNEVIFTRPVYIGDDCPDPVTQGRIEAPTKESTAQYNYMHNGWALADGGTASSNALKNIQVDTVVYSAFKESERLYTIRFFDGETLKQTLSLAYDTVPNPDTPTHSTDPDHYVFDKWEPTITKVMGNADYIAVWREKKALADYTWEELDAMSLEEMKANFTVGEYGPKAGSTKPILLGFENMELADGSGKARMTFGSFSRLSGRSSSITYGWSGTGFTDWENCNYRLADCLSYLKTQAPEIFTYGKPVKVKYTATDGTVKETTDTAFAPSMSQLGYTGVANEGEKFDLFTEKSLTDPLEKMEWLYSVYANASYIDPYTRTINVNDSKIYCVKTQGIPHLESYNLKAGPYAVFCI